MMFSHSTGSPALLALLFAGAALLPSALGAQQLLVPDSGGSSARAVTSAARSPAMLRFASPAVPMPVVSLAPAGPIDVYAPKDEVRLGANVAMMAVGGAGLAVGLLIGGDAGTIIASTGGIIGLIGLYRFLR
jgi:hypothetical protein